MLSFKFSFFLEQRGPELKFLQISPNLNFVALGQPLKLIVTFNVTGVHFGINIVWSFHRFSSTNLTSRKELAKAHWLFGHSLDDSRVSIVGNSSTSTGTLVLVNTTLNDSGTYQCELKPVHYLYTTKKYQLFFNVTIVKGKYLFYKLAENNINDKRRRPNIIYSKSDNRL